MSTKNSVTNTSKAARSPDGGAMHGWVLGGNPGAIERQESAGQAELVGSDVLPSECRKEDVAALEAAGVVFGKHVGDDTLFRHVTLPTGWSKRVTDHAMWSDLVDDKGRVRARIFYKAAFYDRRATMHAKARYSAGYDFSEAGRARGKDIHRGVVKDGETIIHTTEWFDVPRPPPGQWSPGFKTSCDRASDAACAWLDAARPDWKNLAAYWDEP